MRTPFLLATATAGLFGMAAAAVAADVSAPTLLNSGYGELYASYTGLAGDFGSEDKSFLGAGGGLRWSIPFSDAISVQLDGLGDLTQNIGGSENDYEDSLTGAVHLSYRQPESYLFGLFGGISHAEMGDNGHTTAFFAGGEGQWYLGDNTIYLQGGYLSGDNGILKHALFARGQYRHYFNENFRGALEVSYANGRVDDEAHTDVVGWGAELEYKLYSMPLSVFAAYDGTYMNQNPGESDKLYEHVGLLGIRYDFGATSIFERDRRGAGLDTPRFGRWLGEAGGPLE